MQGITFLRPARGVYAAAKAGVIRLTKSAARELGPYGINSNCIAPGTIETGIFYTRMAPEEVEEHHERAKEATLMGRLGSPEDIAKLALFLASDDSSFICGETIVIDGGRIDRF